MLIPPTGIGEAKPWPLRISADGVLGTHRRSSALLEPPVLPGIMSLVSANEARLTVGRSLRPAGRGIRGGAVHAAYERFMGTARAKNVTMVAADGPADWQKKMAVSR